MYLQESMCLCMCALLSLADQECVIMLFTGLHRFVLIKWCIIIIQLRNHRQSTACIVRLSCLFTLMVIPASWHPSTGTPYMAIQSPPVFLAELNCGLTHSLTHSHAQTASTVCTFPSTTCWSGGLCCARVTKAGLIQCSRECYQNCTQAHASLCHNCLYHWLHHL